jgi:hypothetical protein
VDNGRIVGFGSTPSRPARRFQALASAIVNNLSATARFGERCFGRDRSRRASHRAKHSLVLLGLRTIRECEFPEFQDSVGGDSTNRDTRRRISRPLGAKPWNPTLFIVVLSHGLGETRGKLRQDAVSILLSQGKLQWYKNRVTLCGLTDNDPGRKE